MDQERLRKRPRSRNAVAPGQGEQPKKVAERLANLFDAVMRFPEMRRERICELRRAIEKGEYHRGARQIADAILADLLRIGD